MVSEIRIYCEGGGASSTTKDLLRKGLSSFLRDLVAMARGRRIRWHLIACGARSSAYEDFVTALKTFPHAFNVLLVDSEAPVTHTPWSHLLSIDKWDSAGTDDSHCHLMAQAMEAWLIADKEALKEYYGPGFNENALPRNPEVEKIGKGSLLSGLKKATRPTKTKGEYDKVRHGSEILEKLDVAKVRRAAPHCDRLFTTLTQKMGGGSQVNLPTP